MKKHWPARQFRVLLVEDSQGDVRLIREALKETSIPVELTVAHDGIEATDYLRQLGASGGPDLILLDLNLPRKNGREVLAEIKGSPTLRHIPVLVMTSSKAPDDIRGAYSLNANCYITKPINLLDYINVVHAIEDFWFITATLPENFRPPYFPPARRQLAG